MALRKYTIYESVVKLCAISRWIGRTSKENSHIFFVLLATLTTIGPKPSIPTYENGRVNAAYLAVIYSLITLRRHTRIWVYQTFFVTIC